MTAPRNTPARELLEHCGSGLLAFDAAYRVTYANATAARLLGRVELVGSDAASVLAVLFPGGDAATVMGDALTGRATRTPVRQISVGGTKEFFCEAYVDATRDDSGHVSGGMVVLTDMTQNRVTEAMARESEHRFRIMADNAPVLLWMAGRDARCNFFNQKWLEFTGRSMGQEDGYGWAEGVHPADFQRAVDTYMEAFSSRNEFTMEYRLLRHDGEYRWILDNGIPRYLADGAFAGYIGSCIDITDRKLVEEQREALLGQERESRAALATLYRDAEAASRLKDEFLATISHELRTPLNAIAGWAELLAKDLIEPSGYAEAFSAIDRNARAQARLINDLLDVSRIVTGKLRLEVRPVELRAVVDDALKTVALSAQAKKIDVAVRVDKSLGPVEGDASRLAQVAWNLLANAVKFTPDRGSIDVTLSRDVNKAVLVVRDSGQGISPEFLPFVFDRFRQADGSLARRHGGLGLGLAIVKNLVELHGGTVAVHSDGLDRGATFTVTLPLMAVRLDRGDDDREGIASPSRAPTLSAAKLEGITVLAVDDQPDVLRLVTVILEVQGATVLQASSAREALDVLDRYDVDVLLSDIGMPEVDGYQLIRKVRLGKTLPAVAVTAHLRDEDRHTALTSGFQEHLGKPIEPQKLVDTIARLARSSIDEAALGGLS